MCNWLKFSTNEKANIHTPVFNCFNNFDAMIYHFQYISYSWKYESKVCQFQLKITQNFYGVYLHDNKVVCL